MNTASPRPLDAPLAIPADHPAHGLEYAPWIPPSAAVLRFATCGYRTPTTTEGSEARAALAAGLLQLGHLPDEIMFVDQAETNYVGRFLDYAFPATVSWEALPLVGEARWAWAALPSRAVLPGADPARWELPSRGYGHTSLERAAARDAVLRADTLVLDSPALDSRALAEVAEIVAMRDGPAPLVLSFDGARLAPVDPAHLAAAREEWRAHHRFHWSWMLNAMPVWGTALRASGVAADRRPAFPRAFLTPFAAVALLEVARNQRPATDRLDGARRLLAADGIDPDTMGRDVWTRFVSDRWHDLCRAQLDALPFLRVLPGGDLAEFRVAGVRGGWTSPPFRYVERVTRSPARRGMARGPSGVSLGAQAEPWAFTEAGILGLVGSDDEGRAAATDRGRRFADLLRPAFDDPDLLWRWAGPEGQICTDAHVPAADRWLNAAFRRLKRAVADPRHRDVYASRRRDDWNREGTAPANRAEDEDPVGMVMVRLKGRYLRVEPERLLDPGFPLEALRAAVASARDNPNAGGVMSLKSVVLWWGEVAREGLPSKQGPLPADLSPGARAAIASVPAELLALPEMGEASETSLMLHAELVAHALPATEGAKPRRPALA